MRLRLASYLLILPVVVALHGQQAPLNFDTSGNLLVNVAAGGGAGGTSSTFGAAFPGTGTAIGAKDGGGLMQPVLLDGSNFLEVDCKAGCSGAAGDTTASGTLAAGGNTVVMAMAGVTSASFSLPAASTLVGTVVADYSTDGGTSYPNSANLRTSSGQWVSSISVTNTGAAQDWNLQIPGGASHVRVRVSAFTSGTSGVNGALLRGVQQPEMIAPTAGVAAAAVPGWIVQVGGSDGTNLRALSTDTTGKLNTLATATQSGTWTVQPGNTANTTPWLITINQGGNAATVSAAGALKVDGSAVTQPISAASLPLPTGASTAAKQPALGTAGAASADVITIQGIASMTPVKVDGSAVTQPVSGTVTANQGGAPWTILGTLAHNGNAATTNRLPDMPGIAQTSYNAGTAATAGNNSALNVGTDGLLWVAQLPAIRPASYTASAKFAASSTTDNCVLPGNASNTVLVTEVSVTGIQTTAGILNLELAKRSTADTAGTSASMTAVPDDSNYAAAVSAPLSYTGTGPTAGTLVGDVDNAEIGFMATGTASPNDVYIGNFRQKPIVLRGTAQMLAVNLGGAVTGGTMTCKFKWIETATITP